MSHLGNYLQCACRLVTTQTKKRPLRGRSQQLGLLPPAKMNPERGEKHCTVLHVWGAIYILPPFPR